MGIEAYGLIGFFATLTAMFNILDLGLSSTLNRQLAICSVDKKSANDHSDLGRTLEILYWLLSLLIGVIIVFGSRTIANHWLNIKILPKESIQHVVTMMGLVIVFQFPCALYQGGLRGLQKHIQLDVILAGAGTLRGVGAIAVLYWISPTVKMFFVWQMLSSALQVIIMRQVLWKNLTVGSKSPRFRFSSIHSVWKFATGVTSITLVTIILTNIDKVLLSKMLSMEQFGFYMVGATAASGFTIILTPFFNAVFPKFSQMIATGEMVKTKELYHKLCQSVACIIFPCAFIVILNSEAVVSIWTGNPEIVKNSSSIVSLLIAGTVINTLFSVPYAFILADGWTRFTFIQNLCSMVLIVPLLFVLVGYYGTNGAALTMLILNGMNLLIAPHIMHSRLLKTEKWKWYVFDVIIPGCGILMVVSLAQMVFNVNRYEPAWQILTLVCIWVISTFTGIVVSPNVKRYILKIFTKKRFVTG
jgi:O-antigen/teichoic acid export membrane protein